MKCKINIITKYICFKKLIANLREYTKNGAEMNTYETLHYMKRGFIEQGIILDAEFQVMPNVFIKIIVK